MILTAGSRQSDRLTIDNECVRLGLGEACALVESLTGEFQPILLSRDPVGHIGYGCHPTIVSLQTGSTYDSSGRGQTAFVSGTVILMKVREKNERDKNNPLQFVLANAVGKLVAVITNVVRWSVINRHIRPTFSALYAAVN